MAIYVLVDKSVLLGMFGRASKQGEAAHRTPISKHLNHDTGSCLLARCVVVGHVLRVCRTRPVRFHIYYLHTGATQSYVRKRRERERTSDMCTEL